MDVLGAVRGGKGSKVEMEAEEPLEINMLFCFFACFGLRVAVGLHMDQ